jgi:TonB family protein
MRHCLFLLLFSPSLFAGTPVNGSELTVKTEHPTRHITLKYQVEEGTQQKSGFYIVHYDKDLVADGKYKNNKRDGEWKTYWGRDTVQTEGSYIAGKKEGEWKTYYHDGKMSGKIQYVHGKKGDDFILYHKNGKKSVESKPGLLTKYYDNGRVSEVITMKDGKQNGPAKRYYLTGVVEEERTMRDGVRDSLYFFYYEDSTLWEHILYRHGAVWNVLDYHASDGKTINCCTIKDGNGIMRFYDREGLLSWEGEYRNTMRDGPYKSFTKGVLKTMGQFKVNLKEGPWKFYYSDGSLDQECTYSAGKLEGEQTEYYRGGGIYSTGMRKHGEMDGEWRWFTSGGKTRSIENFLDGKLEGDAKYFADGKVNRYGKYAHGEKTGVWINMDAGGNELSTEDFGAPVPPEKEQESVTVMVNEPYEDTDESMPEFPGGEKELLKYIKKNTHYPTSAAYHQVHGKVVVSFVIGVYGEVSEAKVISSDSEELDAEALRVVREMPRWYAGTMDGQGVSVTYSLPVLYSLH